MSDENILGEIAKELEQGSVKSQSGDVTSYMAHEDGKIITGTVQDCTPILEDAQQRRAMGAVGSSEMRHVARLPAVVIELYCNTHGITFAEWLKDPVHARRMTSDPDLSGLRIWRPEDDIRSVGGFESVH